MSIQVVDGKVLSEEEVAAMEATKAAEVPVASGEEGPLPEGGTGHDPIMADESVSIPVNVLPDEAEGEIGSESLDTVPSDEADSEITSSEEDGPEVANPAE